MKLPSVSNLVNSFFQVVKRFPFVLISMLTGTIAAIILIHGKSGADWETILIKIGMVSALGIPLFFAVHIFCEKVQPLPLYRFIVFVVATSLLVQYYFSTGEVKYDHNEHIFRYFFWNAGLHLIVAFSAFFVVKEINGFWQFNKIMFLRFITAGIYSGVLYLGLAGAILAVHELFNVHIEEKIYADLWVVIAVMFNTTFFLGGITLPVSSLNEETDYPKGLKIFTQYVLIPLVSIYLIILYAYTAKIIIQMNLPKGWVANLILGFSVSGILSLLLVYPICEQEENRWLKTFSRFYYYSLVPLVILLFVAIGTRISEYGVTIERYIVAMLGVWLAVITLYFIFSKRKNIILIPLTLSIFLFGSCFGPWGMFKVSERSQLKRLHNLLEKNRGFMGSQLTKLSPQDVAKMKVKDANQIGSILEYLSKFHGFDGMKDWFSADCRKDIFSDSLKKYRYEQLNEVQKCIGVYNTGGYRREEENENELNRNFSCNQFSSVDGLEISGYDRIYNFYVYRNSSQTVDTSSNNFARLVKNNLEIYAKGNLICAIQLDSFVAKLRSIPHNTQNYYTIPPESMQYFSTANPTYDLKLLFSNVNMTVTDSAQSISNVQGYLLLKKK